MKSTLSSISAILAAMASVTCCVGPFMAFAGMLGISASHLIWLASIKNYLIVFSLLAVGYNLYRAYFPPKNQACCNSKELGQVNKLNKKELKALSFLQSKPFLWSIAILTTVILTLPYLSI